MTGFFTYGVLKGGNGKNIKSDVRPNLKLKRKAELRPDDFIPVPFFFQINFKL